MIAYLVGIELAPGVIASVILPMHMCEEEDVVFHPTNIGILGYFLVVFKRGVKGVSI